MRKKKKGCKKDVPSMDSVDRLSEFPMCFVFQFSTTVEEADDLISLTDLLFL